MGLGALTYNWEEIADKSIDSEELLLTNTFLNTKSLDTKCNTGSIEIIKQTQKT